mmetsp:Transcript_26299/g.46399  ORF Transcript_26299/g.46399 Transcript_26299/m.46399 type:complete len:550 (+) Transcript_26299:97-1746(+)
MSWYLVLLVVLFALFVFLCGAGHLLRCMGATHTMGYMIVNAITAAISMLTALYLLPLIPTLMSRLDQNLQDLVKLNQETEESKRKLMTFMAFLCHEIRNPLFIITSTITFLEDCTDTKEEQKSLNLIKQSTDLMLRLVNDVLDISRLESGKVDLQRKDFDLRQTLEGAATSARANLRNKNKASGEKPIEFRSHVATDVPKFVHGDPVRVLQVCLNLLTNAIKFTESGFIDFSVSVCDYDYALKNGFIHNALQNEEKSKGTKGNNTVDSDTDENFSVSLLGDAENHGCLPKKKKCHPEQTVLKVRVEDSGCGIPSEQLERIFIPYSMSKLAQYRKEGGTGLGLAIISKLTSIMKGTVKVRSSVGIGSIFEAYIVVDHATLTKSFASDAEDPVPPPPVLTISPAPAFPSSPLGNEKETSKPSKPSKPALPKFDFPSQESVVLVVDDNAMNRKLLSRMLKSFNLELQEACNGQEAVDAMLRSRNYTGNQSDPRIGFVLMDLSMPVMGGCEATELIRQHGIDVPIMALTAAAIEEGRDRAIDAGATLYKTKRK